MSNSASLKEEKMSRFAMIVLLAVASIARAAEGDFDPFDAYLEEQKNGADYWNCLASNIIDLDDGVSPARQVAELCHHECRLKYVDWMTFRLSEYDVQQPRITDKPSDTEIFDAMRKVLEYRRMKTEGKEPSMEWRTKR